MIDDLVAFLLARIAEDERAVQAMLDAGQPDRSLLIRDPPIHTWIDNFAYVIGDCSTLRVLALPYAQHSDYRLEWAPQATSASGNADT